MTSAYPITLSDDQYSLFESLLPPPAPCGRPREVDLKRVLESMLYILVTGCAWRLLPHDYPPYSTVYYYFRQWRDQGVWKRIHDHCVEWVRVSEGRYPSPSEGALDSQTVPTAVMVHNSVGYDKHKATKGRKRFTLVDTLGLLISIKVMAASTPERQGAKELLGDLNQERDRVPRLVCIGVDGGFSGQGFAHGIMDMFRWVVEVVLRPQQVSGFVLLPKRWVVERTYGWLHWCRRLNVDYEKLPASSESFIYLAMIHLMLRRLA